MANTTIKNGISNILAPIPFYQDGTNEPVIIPTSVTVVCDARDYNLDPQGIKHLLMNHVEAANEQHEAFAPKEFLDEFFEIHSKDYAKLSMRLGYTRNSRTYPIGIEIERIGKEYKATLDVVYSEPSIGFAIDARGTYLNGKTIPHWDDVIVYLDQVAEFYHKDTQTNGDEVKHIDTALALKNRLKSLELKEYNILITQRNQIVVIEG